MNTTLRLACGHDPREWTAAAHDALARGLAPESIVWLEGEADDLFAAAAAIPLSSNGARHARWPAEFVQQVRRVICHADSRRHALLYRVAWRLATQPQLMQLAHDPDVRQLHAWDREVRRAAHKMKAFVRFRHDAVNDVYLSWFDPGHHVLRALAPFFTGRFASMRFVIATPLLSASWDCATLRFGPGAPRRAGESDPCEHLWRTYYASIFNPARLMVRAMKREMPQRYWRDLPEAELIPGLIATAGARTRAMIDDEDPAAQD